VKLTAAPITGLLPALALGVSIAACGGGSNPAASAAPVVPTGPQEVRSLARGAADLIEVGGIAPSDTVLVVKKGEARTLILRHGPPDRAEFLQLDLPATVFADAGKDSVRVTVSPRPGVYGVDLSADADWGPGAQLAFKYAVHFYPPNGAVRKYGTLTEVAKRLAVAKRDRNGDLTVYFTTQPGPDIARAFITGAGSWVMVMAK
jgi:hypothetical protein